jgi:hypothetical protein
VVCTQTEKQQYIKNIHVPSGRVFSTEQKGECGVKKHSETNKESNNRVFVPAEN